jgi:diacylglycerol kinase (ATP)
VRAAAILGPGCSPIALKPFRENSESTWLMGLPAHRDDAEAILVFGGDGTVHRHLRQLIELQLPVLVVPWGSGNDFARALGLDGIRDSLTAWKKFCSGSGNIRAIDIGVITPLTMDGHDAGAPAPHLHYFCCVGGVGLDGEVARRANQLSRWLRAHGGYILSFLPALWRFAPIAMEISAAHANDRDTFIVHNAKPVVVAAFANAPAYGSGMKIAPRARLDDGNLDVCIIGDMNRFKLFCLFPTVYFGCHLSISGVQYFQTERLRLKTDQPFDVFADGEYVCRTPIEVSVACAALRVIRG